MTKARVTFMLLAAVFTGACLSCSSPSSPPPSCGDVAAHYYSAGCMFTNESTGVAYTQSTFAASCTSEAEEVSSTCLGDFNDWLNCLDTIASAACDSCSQSQMTLLECK